ncbi:hypothetical protein [Micromonospora sp. IBHARD004]|uniref:hypothetical protein n=1 Tax=Micromonospora sp. IBHARD004 TaxID=3457764 RepID=UPI004059240D
MSPLANLLLAVLGLPVVVGGVALVARHLVYRHANEYAGTVRREQVARRLADRPKELTW